MLVCSSCVRSVLAATTPVMGTERRAGSLLNHVRLEKGSRPCNSDIVPTKRNPTPNSTTSHLERTRGEKCNSRQTFQKRGGTPSNPVCGVAPRAIHSSGKAVLRRPLKRRPVAAQSFCHRNRLAKGNAGAQGHDHRYERDTLPPGRAPSQRTARFSASSPTARPASVTTTRSG